jgi:DUF4097 and DUF4098 domain-containing protein YvlB
VQQFETAGHVRLIVRNASGWVDVTGRPGPSTEVQVLALAPDAEEQAQRTRVEATPSGDGHIVEVWVPDQWERWHGRRGGVGVRVTLPEGADLEIRTASADVRAAGRLGQVRVETASGDVYLEGSIGALHATTASGDVSAADVAGSAQITTASGDVRVGQVAGSLEVKSASGTQTIRQVQGRARLDSASGDVQVGEAWAPVQARAASGDITVDVARNDLQLMTRSGDITVGRAQQGRVTVEATSGDIVVGVSPGVQVMVDVESQSGHVSSTIPVSPDPVPGQDASLEIRARTLSGDVRIQRGV